MAYTLKHKLGFDDFTVRKFPPNPLFHPNRRLCLGGATIGVGNPREVVQEVLVNCGSMLRAC